MKSLRGFPFATMERTRHVSPVSDDYIDQVFGPKGPFAREFPGYLPRAGQIEFAHAVADAHTDRRVLLAEAGTGVGKSFAALVPTIKSLADHGGKAIVVTANIALQEQYVRKDLPTLQRLLGLPFTFALAKGFSNYICQEARDSADADRLLGRRLPVVQEQQLLERVIGWETKNGDLSDFDVELPSAVKRKVTIPSDECLGKRCSYFTDGCWPRGARKDFGAADIVVTNYHMYFLDLEMKRRGARGVLPEHRIVLFDEAHEMAEIARSYLGERVSSGGIRTAAEDLDAKGRRADKLGLPKQVDLELKRQLEAEGNEFFGDLLHLRRSKDYRARINRPGMFDGQRLESLLSKAERTYEAAASKPGLESEAREWLRRRSALCGRYAATIAGARDLADGELIFYIDDANERATLVREPLSPAKILRESLWESKDPPHSLVLFSATLTTSSSEPFKYCAEQVGVRDYDYCKADSPFDYRRCTFIVPKGLPEPNDRAFAAAVGETLVHTVREMQGRTLALFTSYRVLDEAHRRLLSERLPYTVLRQGQAPRSTLIKQFKQDPSSVLLGTDSFWTGIDVPGDALLAVLIDRIPFDHFEDPVLDAIKERDGEWFKAYYMPKAVIKFKQGFGRLIRSMDDHGVVVCCDKRITSKPYGRVFKHSAPKGTVFSERLDDVAPAAKKAGGSAA